MEPSGLLLLLVFFLPMGSALFPIPIPLPFAPAKIRVDICRLPPATGSCLALFERWYYNPKVRRCLTFTYGGCGGNPNNFRTRRSCELACSLSLPGKPGTCPSPTAHLDKTCGQFCSTDASCPGTQRCCGTSCGQKCQLPVGATPGYCPERRAPGGRPPLCLTSCALDSDCAVGFPGRKCCRYGCRQLCVAAEEEHPGACPKVEVLQTFAPCNDTCADDRQCPPEEKCCFDGCSRACLAPARRPRCQLPPAQGPCRPRLLRYFYSSAQGRCLLFTYSGCGGNSNNFETRRECERACGDSRPEVVLD